NHRSWTSTPFLGANEPADLVAIHTNDSHRLEHVRSGLVDPPLLLGVDLNDATAQRTAHAVVLVVHLQDLGDSRTAADGTHSDQDGNETSSQIHQANGRPPARTVGRAAAPATPLTA
ncbi:MAG: hypothetical protein ACK56F_25080, partial [bacterium]